MGTFTVPVEVGNLARSSFVEIEALVDTGSIHSYIPRDILDGVNAQPSETRAFAFADERVVDIPFGYAVFVVQGMEVIAPVIWKWPDTRSNNPGSGPLCRRSHKQPLDPYSAGWQVRQRQPKRGPLIWLHDGDDVMDIIVPRNTPTEIVVEVQLLTSSSSGFPPRHSDLTAFSMSSVASW